MLRGKARESAESRSRTARGFVSAKFARGVADGRLQRAQHQPSCLIKHSDRPSVSSSSQMKGLQMEFISLDGSVLETHNRQIQIADHRVTSPGKERTLPPWIVQWVISEVRTTSSDQRHLGNESSRSSSSRTNLPTQGDRGKPCLTHSLAVSTMSAMVVLAMRKTPTESGQSSSLILIGEMFTESLGATNLRSVIWAD